MYYFEYIILFTSAFTQKFPKRKFSFICLSLCLFLLLFLILPTHIVKKRGVFSLVVHPERIQHITSVNRDLHIKQRFVDSLNVFIRDAFVQVVHYQKNKRQIVSASLVNRVAYYIVADDLKNFSIRNIRSDAPLH